MSSVRYSSAHLEESARLFRESRAREQRKNKYINFGCVVVSVLGLIPLSYLVIQSTATTGSSPYNLATNSVETAATSTNSPPGIERKVE